MTFQWELINRHSRDNSTYTLTWRSKTFDGWLVKEELYSIRENGDEPISCSLIFILDAGHNWKID